MVVVVLSNQNFPMSAVVVHPGSEVEGLIWLPETPNRWPALSASLTDWYCNVLLVGFDPAPNCTAPVAVPVTRADAPIANRSEDPHR